MRTHLGRVSVMFLALVVALSGIAVGSAAWTDRITIGGTIETATIDWEITGARISLECQAGCGETAWAWPELGDTVLECDGGWGRYFQYTLGDPVLVLPLVAGQIYNIGTVIVRTEDDELEVEYQLTDFDWQIVDSHLYVGEDPPKKCAPGQFPFYSGVDNKPPKDGDYDKSISELNHSYSIPLGLTGGGIGDSVWLAAHAVVTKPCAGGVGDWSVEESGNQVVAGFTCPEGTGTGSLTFRIHNRGTIPIRISDLSYIVSPPQGDPPDFEFVMTTPGVIGAQLHPSESVLCNIDITINAPGEYTLTVTAYAVQWNLYP